MARTKIPYTDEALNKTKGATRSLTVELNKLDKGFEKTDFSATRLGKSLNTVDTALTSLTGVIGGVAGFGLNQLFNAINRVYELNERWAKVVGETNKQLGKFSSNIGVASKAINKANVQMQALTDNFGEGADMMRKMIVTMGTLDKQTLKFASTMGLQLARGYNMGEEGAARFMFAAKNMGLSIADTRKEMGNMTMTARKFNVPINVVAKNLGESTDFMTEFGPAGRKSFTMAAIHLQRFNISLKSAQKLIQHFDTLPDAVESVAKLNIAFGTSLNAIQMMTENDPGKVFENIRQAMLAQGKTNQNLTRQESLLLQQSLGLNSEEIASMLDRQKSHMSLDEIRKEALKNQMKEQNAQKIMQKQLQATAQTLFSFSRAFDRITVAMGNAIKPLLVSLGLAKDGGKEFKSFGQIMGMVTNKIVDFFNSLGKNEKWKGWMQSLAGWIKKGFEWVSKLTTSDFENFFKNITTWAERLAKVSAVIVGLWASSKFAKGIVSLAGAVKSMSGGSPLLYGTRKVMDNSGAFPGKVYKKGFTAGGRALLGGAAGGLAGAGIGSLFGETAYGGAGGAIGGALGGLAGPIGAAIGTAAGTTIGIVVGKIMHADKGAGSEGFFGDRRKTLGAKARSNEILQRNVELIQEQINTKRKIELGQIDVLAKEMLDLGVKTGVSKDRMMAISSGSKATAKEIEKLKTSAVNAWEKIDGFAHSVMKANGFLEETNRLQQQKSMLENQGKLLDISKEQAMLSLETGTSYDKDLAKKIKDKGWDAVFKEVSDRQSGMKTEKADIQKQLKYFKERPEEARMRKGYIVNLEKEVKNLDAKIAKDERFFKVTEEIRKSESMGLRLKQQGLELDRQIIMYKQMEFQLSGNSKLSTLLNQNGGDIAATLSKNASSLTADERMLLTNMNQARMKIQGINPEGSSISVGSNANAPYGHMAQNGLMRLIVQYAPGAEKYVTADLAEGAVRGH